MDEKRIEEIVQKIFKKARTKSISHKKSALSKEIAHVITEKYQYIHSRTLERAHDRYIDKNPKYGAPNAESVNLFCKYLEYKDYGDYLECNVGEEVIDEPSEGGGKWKLIITISIVFGAVLTTTLIFKDLMFSGGEQSSSTTKTIDNSVNSNSDDSCMTWADSLYVGISCDTGPFSKYGTKVEPLDQRRLRNMRKVEVNAAYKFFSEDGKPLIWYYKNSTNEHEYFTAPGLHPVTDETLRKITEGVIEKYVPNHIEREDSFLE